MSATADELDMAVKNALVKNANERRVSQNAFLLSLATELAMDIQRPMDVLSAHGLSLEDFNEIARMPLFQTHLAEAKIAWGATSSAPLRTRAKMEHMVEAALPSLAKELISEGLTGPKVELLKAIMKGGGIGEQAKEAVRDGVTVVINMDAVKEVKAPPVVVIDHNAQDM